MLRRHVTTLAGIALISVSAAPLPARAATTPVDLKPISPWLVDWPKDSCVLARRFGSEKQPFLFSLRSYAPGYASQLLLAGRQVAAFQNRTDVSVRYGSGSPIPLQGGQSGLADGYGASLVVSTVLSEHDPATAGIADYLSARPFPDAAFEKRLDHVTLATRSRQLRLATGPMAGALAELRKCTDDLVTGLGLDAEKQHGLIRTVSAANLDEWAPRIQALFPATLSMLGRGARVILRVVVDTQGQPTRCDTFQTFDNTDFRVQACDIVMRRAKFHPALDAQGAPIASIYSNVIIYKLN